MGLFDWLWPRDRFCDREFKTIFGEFVDAVADSAAAQGPAVAPPDLVPHRHKAVLPAVQRLVAIGDIHGDMPQMKRTLQAAGVIDDQLRWCGGSTTVVQVRFVHLHCLWRVAMLARRTIVYVTMLVQEHVTELQQTYSRGTLPSMPASQRMSVSSTVLCAHAVAARSTLCDAAQHAWRPVNLIRCCLQVGDQLDRADEEVEVLYALERLQREAQQVGGAVHILNGNHETMNIAQDMRYATAGACKSFAKLQDLHGLASALKRQCRCREGWTAVPSSVAPGEQPEHSRPWPHCISGRSSTLSCDRRQSSVAPISM